MGFLKGLIGSAIGDGISKAVSGAVEGAVGKIVKPAAENLANSAAQSINNSASALNEANSAMAEANKEIKENPEASEAFSELKKASLSWATEMEAMAEKYEKDEALRDKKEAEIIAVTALKDFPKWTYGEIVSSSTDESEEYVIINLYVKGSEESADKYRAELEANGFTGDWQIQRKTIAGREYIVDFTFFFESEDNDIQYLIAK